MRKRNKSMPLSDRLMLSPWMKWKKYGRVPWKFLVQMVLTVLSTVQVSFLNKSIPYVDQTQTSIEHMFIPSDMELAKEGPRGGTLFIYTFKDFVTILRNSAESYSNLETFVGRFEAKQGAIMEVEFATNLGPQGLNFTEGKAGETYNVTTSSFGPFDVDDVSQVRRVSSYIETAEVLFLLENADSQEDKKMSSCWMWDVRLKFDFKSNSNIRLDFSMFWRSLTDDLCHSQSTESQFFTHPSSPIFWISLAVIGLSIASLALTGRSLARSRHLFAMAKSHYGPDRREHLEPLDAPIFWESLTLSDKLRFFNLWALATVISNVCCILGSILYLGPNKWWSVEFDHHWWIHLILGLGVAFSWVQNTQYFEFDKEMAIILFAMRTGIPYILRLVLAIGPVFIGYALFGWTFFGAFADTFQSFGDSAVTLFCIVNGDDMHATFEKYTNEDEWIGRIFLVSFVMCFIYCVLNVFIYIMEDAVHSTKLLYKRNAKPSSVFGNGPDFFLDDQLLAEMIRPLESADRDADDDLPDDSFHSPRSKFSSFQSVDDYSNDGKKMEKNGHGLANNSNGWAKNGVNSGRGGKMGGPLETRSIFDNFFRKSPQLGPIKTHIGEEEGEDLLEPLLPETEECEEASMGAPEASEEGFDQSRLFVLQHIFEAQEKMQLKHLEAFSIRLQALEKDHQRSLAEVQHNFVDMVDRRLRNMFLNEKVLEGSGSFRSASMPHKKMQSPRGRNLTGSERESVSQTTSPSFPKPETPPSETISGSEFKYSALESAMDSEREGKLEVGRKDTAFTAAASPQTLADPEIKGSALNECGNKHDEAAKEEERFEEKDQSGERKAEDARSKAVDTESTRSLQAGEKYLQGVAEDDTESKDLSDGWGVGKGGLVAGLKSNRSTSRRWSAIEENNGSK